MLPLSAHLAARESFEMIVLQEETFSPRCWELPVESSGAPRRLWSSGFLGGHHDEKDEKSVKMTYIALLCCNCNDKLQKPGSSRRLQSKGSIQAHAIPIRLLPLSVNFRSQSITELTAFTCLRNPSVDALRRPSLSFSASPSPPDTHTHTLTLHRHAPITRS